MKFPSWTLSVLVAFLFLIGETLGLSLSGVVLWGELESRLQSNFSGDDSMKLECPFMIAPTERSSIGAEVINISGKEVKPVVKLQINQTERETQTIHLAPGKSQHVQWSLDSSEVNFNNLILVNVLQSQYSRNPSRWGSCGVLVFSLFGLGGAASFNLLFAVSVLSIPISIGLWWKFFKPHETSKRGNIIRACTLLAVMTLGALLSTLQRWWGLTLFFEGFSLLLIGTALIDLIIFPQKPA